jgi:hypothetical protein
MMEVNMSVSTITGSSDLFHNFSYPFSDKRWIQKVVVGILLTVAAFIIPLIPSAFLLGYYFRISRRIVAEDGQAVLPEWDDWGKLFTDGIRYLGLSIIYSIPLFLSIIAMYGVPFLSMLPSISQSADWRGYGIEPGMMEPFIMMLFMYPMMGLMLLLSLLTGIFLPPALMHMIARDSFGAGFQFSGWWKVFRANFGGFLIAFLLAMALFMVLYYVTWISVCSIIFCFLAPILGGVMIVFSGLISSALFAQAYRTGAERLSQKSGLANPPADVLPAVVKKAKPAATVRKSKSTAK